MAVDSQASQPRALICGISGQDGAYLTRLLLDKGYAVWGTSRAVEQSSFANLSKLGVHDSVTLVSMDPRDFGSVLSAIDQSGPQEIYYLAGQASVGLSFEQPVATVEGIVQGALNCLEAIRLFHKGIRFFHAGSGECFGEIQAGTHADEGTPFSPRSPYAVAKASAHWLVRNYRESYGLFACDGILFNHESALRPRRFVTQKIIAAARDIRAGRANRLALGRMDISRDWGWAPDYVEAMWSMLQHGVPDDYVIATGVSRSLRDFVEEAFAAFGLDWHEYVTSEPSLFRPSDVEWSAGDPGKAARVLGWQARTSLPDLIRIMADERL